MKRRPRDRQDMPAPSPGKSGHAALVGLARLMARAAARDLRDEAREEKPVVFVPKKESDDA